MQSPHPTTERPETPDERTGLPGFRTWHRVYLLVAASFILWVVLLRLLTVLFA
jgi:hypothetical protein